MKIDFSCKKLQKMQQLVYEKLKGLYCDSIRGRRKLFHEEKCTKGS